ncbi:MAG: Gfo/Idh/MocA family oxidoreductase [Caloramator sp.]|nr:Gfo/Idh/MocA family oxidoreductase [Caloramator sp.]
MKRYKIGIIGTGMRTMFLVNEILKKNEFEIVALSDVSNKNMELLCSRYNLKLDKYTDYKELLSRKDIDAVIICSPDYYHEEQAIAALSLGKHVFLEKPIAITKEGALRVLKKRDESNKILIVGFVLRYNKLYKKMKELIQNGIIGELKTGWVLHSVGAASDWYFHDWHGTMKNTNGLLLQKGSHDFDIINWVVNSKLKKIVAFGSRDFFGGNKPDNLICEECKEKTICTEAIKPRYITWEKANGEKTNVHYNVWRNQCAFRNEIDVFDNHQVLLEYNNGVKVSYMECHYTPDDNREYIFIGTKGKLKLDDANNTITVQIRNNMYDRNENIVYKNLQENDGHGGGDEHILDAFIEAMNTGIQPEAGGEAGLKAMQAGILAYESIKKLKIINL